MKRTFVPLLALAFTGFALADDTGDRANLLGVWQPQDNSGGSWTLQSTGEDELHLTEMEKDQKASDFQCNTVARECEVKDAGQKWKVSMWYNGPRLVVQEIRGPNKVMRYRFHAVDKDSLELELVPIVPEGKPHVIKFVRHTQSASAKN
jgi:hypothetical protein